MHFFFFIKFYFFNMAFIYVFTYLFIFLCGCYKLKCPDLKFIKNIFLALKCIFAFWYDDVVKKGWAPLSKILFRYSDDPHSLRKTWRFIHSTQKLTEENRTGSQEEAKMAWEGRDVRLTLPLLCLGKRWWWGSPPACGSRLCSLNHQQMQRKETLACLSSCPDMRQKRGVVRLESTFIDTLKINSCHLLYL